MARTKQVSERTTATKKSTKSSTTKAPRKKAEVLKKPLSKSKHASNGEKEKEKKKRRSEIDAEKKDRKPRKFKASTVAARECKRYSGGKKDGTKLLLQKKPFQNLVREALQKFDDTTRIKKSALLNIQEGMESWLGEGMERTIPLCRLAKLKAPTGEILQMAIEPIFYGVPSSSSSRSRS